MVPCECGKQFDDLTDWKAHSTMSGHCCIYKCRRPASAASIPGFAFDIATSSTFKTSHTAAWNASETSKKISSELCHPVPYDVWKDQVSSKVDPTKSYPLLGTWNTPAASTLHPSRIDSPLPDTWQGPSLPKRSDCGISLVAHLVAGFGTHKNVSSCGGFFHHYLFSNDMSSAFCSSFWGRISNMVCSKSL